MRFEIGLIANRGGLWAAVLIALFAGCRRDDSVIVRGPGEGGIVLATTPWNAPYSYRDKETGEIVGSDVELAKAAAKRLGRELKVLEMPFSEMMPRVKSGEVDLAAASITITEGRRRDVDFTESYASDGSLFLYPAGNPVPTIPRCFLLRIGTLSATVNHFYLCYHDLNPICYRSYDDAVRDLADGKLDCVFYDGEPVRCTVAASNGKFKASPLETRENYGIAVRKDYPELLAALNEAIRERKAAECK